MSVKKYVELKAKQIVFNKWIDQFRKKDGWAAVPASAEKPVKFTNKDQSYIECIEFIVNRPRKYFAYPSHNKITTFAGETLGSILEWGPIITSNLGDYRRYVRVRGINGLLCWGWNYCSNGHYVRLYAYKKQELNGVKYELEDK